MAADCGFVVLAAAAARLDGDQVLSRRQIGIERELHPCGIGMEKCRLHHPFVTALRAALYPYAFLRKICPYLYGRLIQLISHRSFSRILSPTCSLFFRMQAADGPSAILSTTRNICPPTLFFYVDITIHRPQPSTAGICAADVITKIRQTPLDKIHNGRKNVYCLRVPWSLDFAF